MYKYLSANNTYNYIDPLDGMIKKYNSTVHSAIKMKPKDAAHNKNTIKVYNALYENYKPTYPFYKFDIRDKVRIVKKKKTFEKGYTPNWSEELFVIDIFSKYAWSIPLKTKTASEVTKAFESILTKKYPKKLWVDQGSEFYNKTFDKLLKSKT